MTTTIIASILALAATLLALSRKRIPEGQVYTLRRGKQGQPRLLDAGIHWIVPLRDRITHKISLTGRSLRLEVAAAEPQTHIQGTVYWQVLDPRRAEAVIDEADALIRQQAMASLQADTAGDARARGARVKAHLNDQLRPQGMLVTRLDLREAA